MAPIAARYLLLMSLAATTLQAGETKPPASVRYREIRATEVPNFQQHISPLLGKPGCNGRVCHGSFEGKGGLQLSLFSHDLQKDHDAVPFRLNAAEPLATLLLASRLIEAGVRFVTVLVDGWDTHRDNFCELRSRLFPELNLGYSALLDRLRDRGLLDSTVVLATREFGRTPKINGGAGRDHWARAGFALLAGGRINGGQAVGRTDERAAEPDGSGFSPDDLASTLYHHIGINPRQEFHTTVGRPVTLVRHGQIISGI